MSSSDEEDELDDIVVLQIHGGDGDGAELVFDFNNQRISVSIFPSSPTKSEKDGSIQDRIIELLDRIASGDLEDDERDEIEEEVLIVISEPGRPIFQAHSRPRDPHTPRDLHSIICPTLLHFQLLGSGQTVTVAPIPPSEACTVYRPDAGYNSGEEDELGIEKILPSYSSRAVYALEIFVEGMGHVASRVRVEGASEDMFCKAMGNMSAGLIGGSVGQELEALQNLRGNTTIRVPQLLGYIRHADTDRLVGFVRQWIPGWQLRELNVPPTPVERRKKWLGQIREAFGALHALGTIWGDGKASNILIDEQDDAWLIDFGGGWTTGWVEEEAAGTVEEDKQAIDNIAKFLELDYQEQVR